MNPRLPSLHLLKIFEAAGRHQSFKLAAEELHLTPSAISHQVKALESHLGFALFKRLNRRLELTAGGRAYLDVISDVFRQIENGTSKVLQRFARQRLKISLMNSLASQMLIPNLSDLKSLLLGVDIVIDASSEVTDFHSSDVDVALRFGRGGWPNLHVEKLCQLTASPMCSPALGQALGLNQVEQLAEAPLISFSFMTDSWLKFGHAVGIDGLSPSNDLSFNNYDLAIQAAEQGLGVTLGLVELAQRQLSSDRLIQPFDIKLPMKEGLYLVCRKSDTDRREIHLLAEWVKQQLTID